MCYPCEGRTVLKANSAGWVEAVRNCWGGSACGGVGGIYKYGNWATGFHFLDPFEKKREEKKSRTAPPNVFLKAFPSLAIICAFIACFEVVSKEAKNLKPSHLTSHDVNLLFLLLGQV